MYLDHLSLTRFKNYPLTNFGFIKGINFITGENGAGKTNLLDAIHYKCLGKSYFHGTDLQGIHLQEGFFRLEGNFLNSEDKMQVVCVYQGVGKKELIKNGITYQRLTDHVGVIPVVMIAPDDQSLINEGSEERRRFIDNTISQIDHFYLEDLVCYNRILQQRNAALKQFAISNSFDKSLIETLDDQLTSFGKKIFEKRELYVARMIPLILKYYAIVSGEKEIIYAKYDSVFHHQDLKTALLIAFDKDRQLQRTTVGIHRDDFEFFMNEFPVKKFGSQGQKKSFLMALKLAQFELIKTEKNKIPLLLLDDIFDKLDEHRAHNILQLIAHNGFEQVFITDTGEERITQFQSNHHAMKLIRIAGKT